MPLERFKEAQDSPDAGFATALAELRAGRKTSHWIWYIFPQLAGLGYSSTARRYAFGSLDEAGHFLRDPVLYARLRQAIETVAGQLANGVRLVELMGGTTDALKFASSLTLFRRAAQRVAQTDANPAFGDFAMLCENILAVIAPQGFPACRFTLENAR